MYVYVLQLVSDSNVAMTDGEKRRLEELLAEDSDEQDHITEVPFNHT